MKRLTLFVHGLFAMLLASRLAASGAKQRVFDPGFRRHPGWRMEPHSPRKFHAGGSGPGQADIHQV